MDVGRYDPELLACFEDLIQLFAVTDAVRVFVVQEDRRAVVRTNLMERVAGEVFVTYDLLVGELVERFLHSLKVALELFFRRLPATLEEVLAVVGVDGAAVGSSPHRAFPATDVSSSSKVTW